MKRPQPRSASLLVWLLLAACNGDSASPGPSEARASEASARAVEADLTDLVAAVTPLPATAPIGDQNAWYGRRKKTLARLENATHAHGLAALERYRTSESAKVRCGLLHVAAHNAPDETLPTLVELTTVFGDDMEVRTWAAELLPVASPERALEVLEPILLHRTSGVSHPPEDRLIGAWLAATDELERDPVPLLCRVATDLPRDLAARHAATKALGTTPSPAGRQALEQLMVESSGNHMLRRLAAQSLRDTVPRDELCPILVRIRDNEVDTSFQLFLDDMVRKNCQ